MRPMTQPAKPLTFVEAATPLVLWALGADRATRSRVLAIALCLLVYSVCCVAAWHAAQIGMMHPMAPPVLAWVTLPACVVALVLVRSGRSKRFSDPTMMLPQNALAVIAIGFAYLTIRPEDRGVVMVLLSLVIMFGMYTHTPRQSLVIGGVAVVGLGACMLILSQYDPGFYPFRRELVRFELLVSVVPVLVFTAIQLNAWRSRLKRQREELKQALATVQHLATRDTLTGLYNRRHMQDRLEACLGRLERYGERFTLALIDLDHFKSVNDRHGHKVGDEVLTSFAHAASAVLRESDVLGRWGGEEFLVVFPDTAPEQARRPLERLQAELMRLAVSNSVPGLRVSFSAGLALHVAHATLNHTLERTDAALYEAKRGGRNQVVLAEPVPSVFPEAAPKEAPPEEDSALDSEPGLIEGLFSTPRY